MQRPNPFLDLVAVAEKLEESDVKGPSKIAAVQNEQSYNMLGQMAAGVKGMPGRKR